MKSGNLNFLEPSEQLQACNGTDLPFYHITYPYLLLLILLLLLLLLLLFNKPTTHFSVTH